MPYKQIHWIKLEKRLLNDPRFFTMSESAQLIYIKLLLLCGHLKNKIPRNFKILTQLLRSPYDEARLNKYLEEVRVNFPKVSCSKDFYYIRGFKEMHNWVSPGSSDGVPKEHIDKIRTEKIRKRYVELKGYSEDSLHSDDYARMGRAIKTLYAKSNGDPEPILNGLDWLSTQGYEWTLETLIKKWADYKKPKPKRRGIIYGEQTT